MAVKRGRSQARRNSGSSAPLPGWAWMIIGILLTIVVVLAVPKLLKSDGEQGFFRPTPNPDARPAAASPEAGDSVADDAPAPARVPHRRHHLQNPHRRKRSTTSTPCFRARKWR